MDVFSYSDYRQFITDAAAGLREHGWRSRLAKAAQCSPSWITRVLGGQVHLTPDQGLGIAQYLHLSELETDYFMALLELDRAATVQLKTRIKAKMAVLMKDSRSLGAAVRADAAVSEEFAVKYYSSPIYSMIHTACMMRAFASEEISSRLSLPDNTVARSLKELKDMGLITSQAGKWKATAKNVHLSAQHPISRVGHISWRNRTIQHLQESGTDGLHYSGIHYMSAKDADSLRRKLKQSVLECRDVIDRSQGEVLSVFCLDWFDL